MTEPSRRLTIHREISRAEALQTKVQDLLLCEIGDGLKKKR